MVFQTADILRDVRVALDENRTSDRLILAADMETLAFDDIVRSKIEEAVRRVEADAPLGCLSVGHHFADAVYWESGNWGWIILPDDFMRLMAFRMSDWKRTCFDALTADMPEYALLSSEFKGIRGNPAKPVCAVVTRPEGKVLEFYACKSADAIIEQALYIPYRHIDENGGIDFSQRCYPAVIYMAASLTMTAYGSSERAAELLGLSQSIFK